ncbi:FUSC family protein [Olleya sp. R77988]|uniref:FUSC family protein n=1 Tax=Olleya sp. R77988 TaxID=3093875 RepID=UPI0037C75F70
MRKASIILGLIFAVLAVILAVLPFYKLAFIPAILAFIFGLIAFLKSKKEGQSTHIIQVIFLITIITLGLATYKAIYKVSEVGDTKELELREDTLEEESIDDLEGIIIPD